MHWWGSCVWDFPILCPFQHQYMYNTHYSRSPINLSYDHFLAFHPLPSNSSLELPILLIEKKLRNLASIPFSSIPGRDFCSESFLQEIETCFSSCVRRSDRTELTLICRKSRTEINRWKVFLCKSSSTIQKNNDPRHFLCGSSNKHKKGSIRQTNPGEGEKSAAYPTFLCRALPW